MGRGRCGRVDSFVEPRVLDDAGRRLLERVSVEAQPVMDSVLRQLQGAREELAHAVQEQMQTDKAMQEALAAVEQSAAHLKEAELQVLRRLTSLLKPRTEPADAAEQPLSPGEPRKPVRTLAADEAPSAPQPRL